MFSCLDEAMGYWQMPMSTKSQPKTDFVTHDGLFEFMVMLFGLCSAPATFQPLMQMDWKLFKCLHGWHIVFSVNQGEHLEHLREVFERLRQAGPLLKTQFAKDSESYLGHIVSSEGLCTDPKKIECVQHFSEPTTEKHYTHSLA